MSTRIAEISRIHQPGSHTTIAWIPEPPRSPRRFAAVAIAAFTPMSTGHTKLHPHTSTSGSQNRAGVAPAVERFHTRHETMAAAQPAIASRPATPGRSGAIRSSTTPCAMTKAVPTTLAPRASGLPACHRHITHTTPCRASRYTATTAKMAKRPPRWSLVPMVGASRPHAPASRQAALTRVVALAAAGHARNRTPTSASAAVAARRVRCGRTSTGSVSAMDSGGLIEVSWGHQCIAVGCTPVEGRVMKYC